MPFLDVNENIGDWSGNFPGYKSKSKVEEAKNLMIQANYIFDNGKINLVIS